ncbi:LysM peptidoglycan-binding domain-containing protein [Flavobacterium salilacus subsp. salilacus]|uniref:lytic transglycosylase domain-containing protein n=1 Tax=Flavobacterium TaxID=237 RepID=UPI00107588A2|nr:MULTISPECIES: lytic transglycosylase domain-containing protein [Flavobacterium]KAF2519029.1 LysM peptidoglycan-binding domain-containing protein [Flavobacterium salilacus subsp. salilacus]MBE1614807.1 LysM peptidoglycan-binding domain-containing protein [Flavobacterium sp. SaA2.13]
MNKKRILSVVFAFFSFAVFAQESAEAEVSMPEVKLSYIDSLKATFIHNEELTCVDSLWVKELISEDLFAAMQEDIQNINPDDEVDYDLSTPMLKERLAKLDAVSPFHIEYSKGLENIIKAYLKNRPRSFSRLMALSEYYFPLFEEYLSKYNVPMEIKYLAVIESALNPRAKSRVGATGLWQFMYPTGKQFNLEVNSYVDERCDPIKATEAACQYLSSLYNIFGDWDLVLASYNAGPGNVTKAIRRSGSYKNYWNIRPKLPKETQGYVPAFLATMYVYEYSKEHGITGNKAPMTYFETDTVMVKRQMSFKQIAGLLDVPMEQLQLLNPIYKLDVIPYTIEKPHYLRLPKDKIGLFTSNEKAIYAYIDYEANQREKPHFVTERQEAVAQAKVMDGKKIITTTETYKVRSGDNLGAIANKYNISVSELKQWNGLRGNMIRAGQNLKIKKEKIVDMPKPKVEAIAEIKPKEVKKEKPKPLMVDIIKPVDEEAADEVAEETEIGEETETVEVATVTTKDKKEKDKEFDYEKAHLYIVQKGDSLFSIARKHPGVTVENLKSWNKIQGENIKPGMKLKVIVN